MTADMRHRATSPARGATLTEILLVVVVLGLVAAVVVPRYSKADQVPIDRAVDRQVDLLRDRIADYRARNGRYPRLIVHQWDELIAAGLLRAVPVNPVNGHTAIGGEAGPEIGWIWRPDAAGKLELFAVEPPVAVDPWTS